MSEQGTTTKRDTSSKREQVFAWLTEHHQDGMSTAAVASGVGCAFDTAKRYLTEWTKLSGGDASDDAKVEDATDDVADDVNDDSDDVVVSRAYLLTLEALRDQVLETQRLRRMLDER